MKLIKKLLDQAIFTALYNLLPNKNICIESINTEFNIRRAKFQGHFQSNAAFKYAKDDGISPFILAVKVAYEIKSHNYLFITYCFASFPGFINFFLGVKSLHYLVNRIIRDNCRFDVSQEKTIIIDFGGPNIAKPLHIGHIRSLLIGESLRRLYKFLGNKVISDIHLGDCGTHIGMVLLELINRNNLCISTQNSLYTLDTSRLSKLNLNMLDLLTAYKASTNSYLNDQDIRSKISQITHLIQTRNNAGLLSLFDLITNISLQHIKKIVKMLDVHFDLWKGESSVLHLIPDVLLKLKGVFKDNSATLIRVEDKKNLILQKSDGSYLYRTTELATLFERALVYDPNEIIYVVDKRQKEHFDLVFKIAKDNQIVSEKTNLTFLGFGTVNDTVNKPLKTRGSGEFNSLIDTLEIAISKGKKKDSNTEIIVLSNIKFSFLSCKYSSSHKYIPDQLTRYDGYSGAYILYTIMRIRSLFNKHSPNFTEFTIDDDISITTSVRDLLLQLIQFPDCIVATSTTKNTQHLTKQAYNIAYSFNILYEQISFLTQAEKYKTYLLKICSLTLLQLETLAFLLGMRIPEKM